MSITERILKVEKKKEEKASRASNLKHNRENFGELRKNKKWPQELQISSIIEKISGNRERKKEKSNS